LFDKRVADQDLGDIFLALQPVFIIHFGEGLIHCSYRSLCPATLYAFVHAVLKDYLNQAVDAQGALGIAAYQ